MSHPTPNYAERVNKVQAAMAGARIDLVILNHSANFTYLTGIPYPRANPTGAAMPNDWLRVALLTQDGGPILATSGDPAEFEGPAADRPWIQSVQSYDGLQDPATTAKALLAPYRGAQRVALSEPTWALASLAFQAALPDAHFTMAEPLFWPLRALKDEAEVARLRRAAEITDQTFGAALKMMRLGVTLQDITDEILARMLRLGASGTSFSPSVIFNGPGFEGRGGPNKAVPLQPGCLVAFDMGVVYDGYCSDFGRSVIVGEPRPDFLRHCQMLRQARDAAVARIRPGIALSDVHEAVHAVFADYGWEEEGRVEFGHNLGLDIHEPPYVTSWDHSPLQEGMVLAVEPRAYRNGIVGGRVEDMLRVTATGAEPLTTFSLDLLVI